MRAASAHRRICCHWRGSHDVHTSYMPTDWHAMPISATYVTVRVASAHCRVYSCVRCEACDARMYVTVWHDIFVAVAFAVCDNERACAGSFVWCSHKEREREIGGFFLCMIFECLLVVCVCVAFVLMIPCLHVFIFVCLLWHDSFCSEYAFFCTKWLRCVCFGIIHTCMHICMCT